MLGLNAEEARTAAGLSVRSCYWKRCSELRQMGVIKETGDERPGDTELPQIVSEITPLGTQIARELLAYGHATWPEYISQARSADPATSHVSQHNPARKVRASSQQALLLLAFHSEMENR